MLARDYPGIGWIGLCDINAEIGEKLKQDCGADFFTTRFEELIARPEVTATIIATDENNHARPTLAAVERGHSLFIEKPLATDAGESEQILRAIEAAGVDAVLGYTQRFRRRFLAVKERLVTGQIGDVHSVVTRAFMNRMVPIATTRRTNDRAQPHADGRVGDAQPRHVAVADGGKDGPSPSMPVPRTACCRRSARRTRPSAFSRWTTARSGR